MITETRIDFKLNKNAKSLIEKAAALSGQSLSDFAKTTLVSKARHVLKRQQQTLLSDRDRDIFLAMLDADAKPNAALKKAVRAYAHSVGA